MKNYFFGGVGEGGNGGRKQGRMTLWANRWDKSNEALYCVLALSNFEEALYPFWSSFFPYVKWDNLDK